MGERCPAVARHHRGYDSNHPLSLIKAARPHSHSHSHIATTEQRSQTWQTGRVSGAGLVQRYAWLKIFWLKIFALISKAKVGSCWPAWPGAVWRQRDGPASSVPSSAGVHSVQRSHEGCFCLLLLHIVTSHLPLENEKMRRLISCEKLRVRSEKCAGPSYYFKQPAPGFIEYLGCTLGPALGCALGGRACVVSAGRVLWRLRAEISGTVACRALQC